MAYSKLHTSHPEELLELVSQLNLPKDAEILDVGGETSNLANDLLFKSFKNITVLNISQKTMKVSQYQSNYYDLWYDGVIFHSLTDVKKLKKYIQVLNKSLKRGGYAIIVRYSFQNFENELGQGFELKEHLLKVHRTPFDTTHREFLYCLFKKRRDY